MDEVAGSQALVDEGVGQDVVLESLRGFHQEHLRREQGLVLLAVQWARLNPGVQRTLPDGSPNTSRGAVAPEDLIWEDLAARGCPQMDDLAIPTFAVAAGISEFQARKLVRESLMLVFLLPRVWKAASAGQVDVWRARALAGECWDLSLEAVDYVDRLMALSTARHTQAGRAGVLAEAKERFMPQQAEEERQRAAEARDVKICGEHYGSRGVAEIWGTLDATDAIELENALTHGARLLKDMGSDAPLGVRRAWALGDLARMAQGGFHGLHDESLRKDRGLSPGDGPRFLPDCACALGLRPPGVAPPVPEVMVYLHMTPNTFTTSNNTKTSPDSGPDSSDVRPLDPDSQGRALSTSQGTGVSTAGDQPVVRVEGGNSVLGSVPVHADVVRSWFTRPRLAGSGPKIIFRPVIDMAEHQHTDAYEVPQRIKEQVHLRDRTCMFPWCTRNAQRTDCDHTIPWRPDGRGGPTCSCNLAPLCRSHHRAKTHADNHKGGLYTWWNYESLGDGTYLWKGPKGSLLLRTPIGTYDVSNGRIDNGPAHPAVPDAVRTLKDVTTPDEQITTRVQAAAKVVEMISVSIPQTDPPTTAEEDEQNLEFPIIPAPPREVSWFQEKLRQDPEDPPKYDPGSLGERLFTGRAEYESRLHWALGEYMTGIELYTTPQQRALREKLAKQQKQQRTENRKYAGRITWHEFNHEVTGYR